MIKRHPGEWTALIISVLVTLIVSFFILQISIYVLVFLLIVQLIYVVTIQKQLQGNSIRITETQYAKLHNLISESCTKLGMELPHCFVSFDPYINAYVLGFTKPYSLVLTSALIEAMNDDELRFVVCHELGHIRMGHSRLKSLVMPTNNSIPVVTLIFNNWLRKTEYTADRAGIFATEDIKASISALKKIAVGSKLAGEIDSKALIKQVCDACDENVEKMSEWLLTHPYITNRIKCLVEYYNFVIGKTQ